MQSQMSSASAPSPLGPTISPGRAPATPVIVPPVPRKPRRMGLWGLLFLSVVAIAGFLYYTQFRAARPGPARPGPAAVRTAKIFVGDLNRTIYLSGTVSAERYAGIMVPNLRGSRGGRGRSGPGGGGGGGVSSASTASSTSGGTSSSASSSSGSIFAGSTSGTRSSLGTLRGSTNRFSNRSAVRSGGSTSSSSSRSGSSSTSSGLGSTSSSLMSFSRGGGGGGGGDWMTVLVKLAKAGASVRKGDVVAEFDRQYQLNRLDDYRASVTQHEASLKRQKAELAVSKEAHNQKIRVAKAELDKAALDLKTAEVRSDIEAETLKLSLEEAQAYHKQLLAEVKFVDQQQHSQIREAELDLNQAKVELKRAELNIERMVLRAPIDGIVVMQTIFRSGEFGQVQEGDMLHPGMLFMQIVDPSSMVLNASVNQVDAEALRLSMKAVARFDAYPGLELTAHVIGIGAMTKPGTFRASYMREVPVKLRLEQMDPRVIPDLSASAEVKIQTERQATIAPRGGIFYDGGSPVVFLRTAGGFERRNVELGLSNHTAAVVRSGLKEGDVIALERPPSKEQQ